MNNKNITRNQYGKEYQTRTGYVAGRTNGNFRKMLNDVTAIGDHTEGQAITVENVHTKLGSEDFRK